MKFSASVRFLTTACVASAALLAAGGCESTPKRGCDDGQKKVNGECTEVPTVFVDSVGYLPNRIKIATFVDNGKVDFEVKNLEGEVVFKGKAGKAVVDPDTSWTLRQADFTDLKAAGAYYVEVPGRGRSAEFRIAKDVFEEPLEIAMLGLTGQRCGVEVDIVTESGHFHHDECHTEPASLTSIMGQEGEKDDTGGWHDAGDYGKYTTNGAFAVAFLLKAYEHFPERLADAKFNLPESDNDVPDILDEARVELEWLLKTQLDDGSAAHKVTAKAFESTIMPEDDAAPRFFVPIGTVATADIAAIMALAARIYEPFDAEFSAKCLAASLKAYEFLQANLNLIEPNQSGFSTGGYGDGNDGDERLWAAAEIFETTGDEAALADFEQRALARAIIQGAFDWPSTGNLALITYLFSAREGRNQELVDTISSNLLNTGDNLVDTARSHGFGRSLGSTYYWGVNGSIARTGFPLAAAYRVTQDAKYLDALTLQLDHLFGRNPYGRSYVTAVGFDSPKAPHHRPSQADTEGNPWPGLLVGGPHAQGQDEGTVAALAWTDTDDNYFHNEIAINWNTALIYTLVAAE